LVIVFAWVPQVTFALRFSFCLALRLPLSFPFTFGFCFRFCLRLTLLRERLAGVGREIAEFAGEALLVVIALGWMIHGATAKQ